MSEELTPAKIPPLGYCLDHLTAGSWVPAVVHKAQGAYCAPCVIKASHDRESGVKILVSLTESLPAGSRWPR